MKRIALELARIVGLSALIWAGWHALDRARAGVSCSITTTFVNGTVADAGQMNVNNQNIIACMGLVASAGPNNDITSLSLTTPLAQGEGGANQYIGGTVTGSANAIVLAAPTPSTFTLTKGFTVSFVATANNTALTTINVGSLGAKTMTRKTPFGTLVSQGGELWSGNSYKVQYDGANYVLEGETFYVGEIKDMLTLTAPNGYLPAGNQAVSRTTFQSLFAVIGTVCGAGDGSTTFNVCDFRGALTAGYDSSAGRLSNLGAGSCGTNFNSIAVLCANGSQNHLQIAAEVAQHNHTIVDNGHTHSLSISGGFLVNNGGADIFFASTGQSSNQNPANGATNSMTGITINNSATGGTAMPIVKPTASVMKMIRY